MTQKHPFLSWIANEDLKPGEDQCGPIINVLRDGYDAEISRLVLLSSHSHGDSRGRKLEAEQYVGNLKELYPNLRIEHASYELDNPADYEEVTKATEAVLQTLRDDPRVGPKSELTILLASGTPTMVGVWVLLSQTSWDGPLPRLLSCQLSAPPI